MIKKLEALKALETVEDTRYDLGILRDFDDAIAVVRKALTPPTADEVCEALSEYLDKSVYYENGYFLYRKEEFYNQPFIIAYKYKSGLVELTKNVLPPHLITMIGRFYQSLKEELK